MIENLLVVAALGVLAALLIGSAVLSTRVLVKRPGSWLVRVVGHQWWSIAVVLAIGSIPLPVGPWDLARIAVGGIMLGVVVGAARAHDLTLCEKCIAAWPLDAPARAERRRGWLLFWHRSGLPMIGSIVAVLTLAHFVPLSVMIQTAVFVTVFLLRDRAHAIHTPLQPWCPICGDDDGGGGEAVQPEPDPSLGRSR